MMAKTFFYWAHHHSQTSMGMALMSMGMVRKYILRMQSLPLTPFIKTWIHPCYLIAIHVIHPFSFLFMHICMTEDKTHSQNQ